MAYPVIADLKDRIGYTGTDKDALFTDLLDSATRWFRRYCGRDFEPVVQVDLDVPTDDLRVSADGKRLALRDVWSSITAVKVMYKPEIQAGDEFRTLVVNTDYYLVKDDVTFSTHTIVRVSPVESWQRYLVALTGTSGLASCPADVADAIVQLAEFSWRRSQTGGGSGARNAGGSVRVNDDAIPEYVLAVAKAWRR